MSISFRRRRDAVPPLPPPLHESMPAALEDAPIPVLVLAPSLEVVAANAAARAFFRIQPAALPAGLVEVTREGRIVEVMRSGLQETEARLTHRRATVRCRILAGASGHSILFVQDVTRERRLETVRQEFVANLSHELKTPLASLRLSAETLLADLDPETRIRFAERVLTEADHLLAVIDNLRQLADIEAGEALASATDFELGALVQETVQRLRASGCVEWRFEAPVHLHTDRAKLGQALANLLDNAIKFSPEGSRVKVRCKSVEDEVQITVRDHGRGISPEHWERVFERFYKVDPARPREVPGTGLGLAITKHLVQLLGGRVWTQSARRGGQLFGIGLPRETVREIT